MSEAFRDALDAANERIAVLEAAVPSKENPETTARRRQLQTELQQLLDGEWPDTRKRGSIWQLYRVVTSPTYLLWLYAALEKYPRLVAAVVLPLFALLCCLSFTVAFLVGFLGGGLGLLATVFIVLWEELWSKWCGRWEARRVQAELDALSSPRPGGQHRVGAAATIEEAHLRIDELTRTIDESDREEVGERSSDVGTIDASSSGSERRS